MGLTVKAPIQITLTLPENWQECKTPQELAYWLIARFDELAPTHDIEDIRNSLADIFNRLDLSDNDISALESITSLHTSQLTAHGERLEGLELSRAYLAQEIQGLLGVVSYVADVQKIDARGNSTFNINASEYPARRYCILVDVHETINFTLSEDIADGDYLDFVFQGSREGLFDFVLNVPDYPPIVISLTDTTLYMQIVNFNGSYRYKIIYDYIVG